MAAATAAIPSSHSLADPFARPMADPPPDDRPTSPSASPKTFKKFRSSLEQTLRAATRGRAKSPLPPALDDHVATATAAAKGKGRENAIANAQNSLDRDKAVRARHSEREREDERAKEKDRERERDRQDKDKDRSKMLKRLESKVGLRRPARESDPPTPTPPARLSNAKEKTSRLAGFTSFITPSLRQASMSSPALHLPSDALPSPTAESFVPGPSSSNAGLVSSSRPTHARRFSAQPTAARDVSISSPSPLLPKRATASTSNGNASTSALPARSTSRTRPIPLPLTSPSTSSLVRSSPIDISTRHARSPSLGLSPPTTPTQGSPSRGHLVRKGSAAASASTSHLPLPSPSTPRARSPGAPRSPRVASPSPARAGLHRSHGSTSGSASASTSHLPLTSTNNTAGGGVPTPSSSSSGLAGRRTSLEARPSLSGAESRRELRRSLDQHRPSPSVDLRRPSLDQHPSSPSNIMDPRRPSLDNHRSTPSDASSAARRPSLEASASSSSGNVRRTSIDARRTSLDQKRPSLDVKRPPLESMGPATGVRRPSGEMSRTGRGSPSIPARATTPSSAAPPRVTTPSAPRPREVSPTPRGTTNNPNTSTTSLSTAVSPSSSNPVHREIIRAASSILVRELRQPAGSGKSINALSTAEWDEVDVRIRALVRMERMWGKSGTSTGASSSQVNLVAASPANPNGGISAAGEDRERRLFSEALRDGYVLCILMNKYRPGSISRVDPREDGFVRTSNVTKFLASSTSHGLPRADIFLRDDLIENTSESLARVASTIVSLAKWAADGPGSERPKVLMGGGGRNAAAQHPNSPYGQTSRSPSAASTPNLAIAQRSTTPTLPLIRTPRRREDSDLEDGRAGHDTIVPLPPPRSPLRIRTNSFGQSNAGAGGRTMSESTSGSDLRQSIASSAATESTYYSSLLEVQRSTSFSSTAGGGRAFGTMRTTTTEATSVGPSDGPSTPTADSPSFSLSSSPPTYLTLAKLRERKPSESGAPVDLSRVAEETEESSASSKKGSGSAGGSSTDDGLGAKDGRRERAPAPAPINLGKGKWPDDFISAFSTPPQSPNTPQGRQSSSTERVGTSSSISPPRKLAVVSEISPNGNGNADPVPYYGPRRPTHRPRHSVDTPSLPLKTPTGVNRDPSPDGTPSSPSHRVALRRNSAKAGSLRPTGIYSGSSSNLTASNRESARDSSTLEDGGSSNVSAPRRSLDSSGVLVPFPRSTSEEQGSPAPADRVPVPPRGRFQSEVDGASSRRRPRPSSFDDLGGRPGRLRYESMVNLGGGSRNTSASDLLQRESMASKDSGDGGSAMRQSLIVREEGRPSTHFQFGNCIGRGQFGAVYRALNLNTGQMVAVKRVRLEGLNEEEIKQLMKEVDLLKSLSHPSIVKYEGMTRDSDFLNIVLEYAENGSLGQTLKSFGKLNERLIANYVVKILEGLHYLHMSDVVHCDLKAANILTTKTGNIKLSDFGVSLNLRAVEKDNDVAGTPNWMAPEVIELKGASPKSDIWSLACTIIELLTGRPPYAEIANSMSVMFRIVEDEQAPIPDGCSEDLQDFLKLCLQKDPDMRPDAETLCEHEWLRQSWGINKELRPQDSIPFLRRVSTGLSRDSAQAEFLRNLQTLEDSPASPSQEFARRSMDYLSSTPPQDSSLSVPFGAANESSAPREHNFVKTTFGKPVICRVCLGNVKKSAVLCQDCSLICHSRCAVNAPPTCDLRAQLLHYARYSQQSGNLSTEFPGRKPDSSLSLVSEPLPATGGLMGGSDAHGPSSASPAAHPPTAFRMFNAFKRSRSSLVTSPDAGLNSAHSGASATTVGPVEEEEESFSRRKRGVLKRPSRSKVGKSQSISSATSTDANTSSLRSSTTQSHERSQSLSSRHHVRRSAMSSATIDASPAQGRVSFADEVGHRRPSYGQGYERHESTPGEFPVDTPSTRNRKRDSKGADKNCIIQ